MSKLHGDHTFQINEWQGDKLLQRIAGADNALVARAAFDKICEIYPKNHYTLQQGARVIEERRRE